MNEITGYRQLQDEIKRLNAKSEFLEKEIQNDLRQIKEDFTPVNLLLSAVSSITGIRINRTDLFKEGLAYGISMLVQRFILKTEKQAETRIYQWVDSLFEKVKEWLRQYISYEARREERQQES